MCAVSNAFIILVLFLREGHIFAGMRERGGTESGLVGITSSQGRDGFRKTITDRKKREKKVSLEGGRRG